MKNIAFRALGRSLLILTSCLALAAGPSARAQTPFADTEPERVAIRDYVGEAMEPFISRDGRYLFFNTPNDPPERTDLLVAVRVDARTFRSLGPLRGANSPALDAVASMDRLGRLYFISTRNYESTLNTLFTGQFQNDEVRGARALQGLASAERGRLFFDAEISADGLSLYYVDGQFVFGQRVPWNADILVARRYGGQQWRFARDGRSRQIFDRINSDALEYAPSLSADEREMFFTRLARPPNPFARPAIYRATRPDPNVPFGAPQRVPLRGYVEAASVAPDGSIYFHRREDGRYRLYRLARFPD